jgi:hypothetical protein
MNVNRTGEQTMKTSPINHPTANNMHAVTSSVISNIGWSRARQELTVEFKTGKIFVYTNVNVFEFWVLLRAPSVGKIFNQKIRGKKAGFPVHGFAPSATPLTQAPKQLEMAFA